MSTSSGGEGEDCKIDAAPGGISSNPKNTQDGISIWSVNFSVMERTSGTSVGRRPVGDQAKSDREDKENLTQTSGRNAPRLPNQVPQLARRLTTAILHNYVSQNTT